ncbi:hypothetical protein Q4603_21980 [Zobellia galactanivorans]|uniref:hypothetical protein n=1 Tax=Zobellia galactanivorans (strain DSM 12802 / CCUG 47099 / CIP 106680 / NCIMB 13871 / Dsij) TaxID=63186 RepID=UPI0026E19D76|nr:hypothetical protein [Zobellia galactanivorans]MDO6811300.1 hypothetical protein [Zobellia galactanivorans]
MEIYIIVIFGLIAIGLEWSLRLGQKKQEREIKAYLQTLEYVDIDADTITVDGTSYVESVPVDVYDTELDPNSPNFYRGTGGTSDFKFRDTFHKQKDFTRFKSIIYLTIPYRDREYEFSTTLPIDQTTLRMRLYLQKKLRAYIQWCYDDDDSPNEIQFLLDFRFMNEDEITLVPTDYYRVD